MLIFHHGSVLESQLFHFPINFVIKDSLNALLAIKSYHIYFNIINMLHMFLDRVYLYIKIII